MSSCHVADLMRATSSHWHHGVHLFFTPDHLRSQPSFIRTGEGEEHSAQPPAPRGAGNWAPFGSLAGMRLRMLRPPLWRETTEHRDATSSQAAAAPREPDGGCTARSCCGRRCGRTDDRTDTRPPGAETPAGRATFPSRATGAVPPSGCA